LSSDLDGRPKTLDLTVQQKASLLQKAGYPTDGSWDIKLHPDGNTFDIVHVSEPVVKVITLTQDQLKQGLQARGYDTNKFSATERPDGSIVVTPSRPSNQGVGQTILPPNIHYIITRENGFGVPQDTWFSRDEPKPYGSGYRFTDITTGSEQVVTGDITISKIQ
jgi:hypothetical protein